MQNSATIAHDNPVRPGHHGQGLACAVHKLGQATNAVCLLHHRGLAKGQAIVDFCLQCSAGLSGNPLLCPVPHAHC